MSSWTGLGLRRRLRQHLSPPGKPPPVPTSSPRLSERDWQTTISQHSQSFDALLHPTVQQWLSTGQRPKLEEFAPDLFRLPLLSAQGVEVLNAELDAFNAWVLQHTVEVQRPNSMNHHGVVLGDIGFQAALNHLNASVLRPLVAELFPGGESLDGAHGFIVEYGLAGDQDLGFHVDDSEVTMNLCLRNTAVGSELYFQGRRCANHRQDPVRPGEEVVVGHQPGVALIHAGSHRHGVYGISQGARRNLILWSSSSAYRAVTGFWDPADWCPSCP